MGLEIDRLEKFLHGYQEQPLPQEIDNISGDFQLAGLKPILGEKIKEYHIKRIIDMGCGNAVLLKCLCDIKVKLGLEYLGVDLKQSLSEAYKTILELDATEYAQLKILQKFSFEHELKRNNQLIIYRNVFHELTISQTANIIYELYAYMKEDDVLVIQDMTVLPVAENSNVGWDAHSFDNVFKSCGFITSCYEDTSKGGIKVFLLIMHKDITKKNILTESDITNYIIKERNSQLEMLLQIKNNLKDSEAKVVIARLDHDIFALSNQLGKNKSCVRNAAAELAELALTVAKEKNLLEQSKKEFLYASVSWFQNRGTPVQMIDQFLLESNKKILQVCGPKLIGKKTLIWRALEKIAHNRLPIKITLTENISIISIFEQLILGINGNRYMDSELLSKGGIGKEELYSLLEKKEVLADIVKNTILVFGEIETICDFENGIDNEEVTKFIALWVEYAEAKIILDSYHQITKVVENCEETVIWLRKFNSTGSKFGEHQYPVHMLQELVPMKYRINDGIGGFPSDLLDLLDNQPYFIFIAAKIISNCDDVYCLESRRFIQELKVNLMGEIVSQFKMTEKELKFINLLLVDGIRYTEELLDCLYEYKNEKNSLVEKGLLYRESGNEYKLTNIIIEAGNKKEYFDFSEESIEKIQKMYLDIYTLLANRKANPLYIRKRLYYEISSGNLDSISDYSLEQAANMAEKLFQQKKYNESVAFYDQIEKYTDLSKKSKMRKASAMVRSGNVEDGGKLFKNLISKYQSWIGLRNSYIDALLFLKVNKYTEQAIEILKEIPISLRKEYWYFQMARAMRVLLRIPEAFEYFDQYYLKESNIQSAVCRILDFKEFAEEVYDYKRANSYLKILSMSPYCEYLEAQIEVGKFYLKNKDCEGAAEILQKAYKKAPKNPYCILALVQTYCELEDYSKVTELLNIVSESPIIKYARIYVKQSKKEFVDGEKILNQMVDNSEINLHMMTQWMEFYQSYYQDTGDKQYLKKAVRYHKELEKSINIPALLLLLNIYKELGYASEISAIKEIILNINPLIEIND